MRKTLASALLTAGLLGASVVSASTASAAPGGAAVAPLSDTPAPVCVVGHKHKYVVGSYDYWIVNSCSATYRVRIALSAWPDLPCVTLAPGQTSPTWNSVNGSFQGTIRC